MNHDKEQTPKGREHSRRIVTNQPGGFGREDISLVAPVLLAKLKNGKLIYVVGTKPVNGEDLPVVVFTTEHQKTELAPDETLYVWEEVKTFACPDPSEMVLQEFPPFTYLGPNGKPDPHQPSA